MNPVTVAVIVVIAFAAGVALGRRSRRFAGVSFGAGLAQREAGPTPTSHVGYNFTDSVRRALSRARQEAGQLGHQYVGAEHILLGLLQLDEGVSIRVLERLHIERATLRAAIEGIVKGGTPHTTPDLPYTSRAKRVLENSMRAARDLGHNYVGDEHLLLGLAMDGGLVGQALAAAGADEKALQRETLAVLLA